MRATRVAFPLGLLLLFSESVSAHYLYIAVDADEGEHGQVNVYFQEGALPGPGKYLDPIVASGRTWVRVPGEKPRAVETKLVEKEGLRWISGTLPVDGPRSVESYGKYGVYTYGKTNVRLHYFARVLECDSAADLKALARSEECKLDVVPEIVDGTVRATVLWEGKPAAGRKVLVRGPKGFKYIRVETDEKGQLSFPAEIPGRYTFRAGYDYPEEGTDDGKEYTVVRYHTTLAMDVPAN